jgi:hypothetical protein
MLLTLRGLLGFTPSAMKIRYDVHSVPRFARKFGLTSVIRAVSERRLAAVVGLHKRPGFSTLCAIASGTVRVALDLSP